MIGCLNTLTIRERNTTNKNKIPKSVRKEAEVIVIPEVSDSSSLNNAQSRTDTSHQSEKELL